MKEGKPGESVLMNEKKRNELVKLNKFGKRGSKVREGKSGKEKEIA